MPFTYNFATGKLDYYKETNLPVVPDVQVFFSTDLPTDVGVVFSPDTPALENTLYISETTSQVYTYADGIYSTYVSPTPNNTPFYLFGTTVDAGGNKSSMLDRQGAIAAASFNTKRGWTYTGASNNNKWWKVFDYQLSNNGMADSLKIQMNEFNESGGSGKSVVFDIIVKRQDPTSFVTVNIDSGVTSFDLSNFEVLYNSTTKRVSFFYKVTTTYTYTNWLVLNSILTSVTNYRLVWNNTLIGTSLSGQTNNTITKTISLNKINGAYTLPSTDGTSAQVLSTNGSGAVSWTTIASAIPQAQIIYVDSVSGVNSATGRGNVNTPYLTPEYALSNTTNTGTITGNTATNTTISAISDANNANLEVGMYLSGSGIPFGTIIVAKGNQGGNANTVTLSKATTATATGITITWWKTYELRLSGVFNAASNWYKQGFYINIQTSKVYWGNLTLYNITESPSIPYYSYSKGYYIGTHINSVLCSTAVSLTRTTDSIYYFEVGTTQSVTTGRIFDFRLNASKEHPFDYVTFIGTKVDASFGYVFGYDSSGSGTVPSQTTINFDSYGLLGGILITYGIVYGNHKCPSSITVLSANYSNIVGIFTGSMSLTRCSLAASVLGSTFNFSVSTIKLYPLGTISTINSSTSDINFGGYMSISALNITAGINNIYGYSYPVALSISSGATMVNFSTMTDDWFGNSFTNSGTFINNGTLTGSYLRSITNNGTIENYGKIIALGIGNGANSILRNYAYLQLNSYGLTCSSATTVLNRGIITTASVGNTLYLILLNNASAIFKNYGVIENTSASATQSLIDKTVGKLQLFAGSELRVSNSKSPIRCTANTSASKDIYAFNVVTNCDGSTYGLGIAYDGSSFAPNDLVGGIIYENTNY